MKHFIFALVLITATPIFSQENALEKLQFIIGNWSGTGTGFGNNTSTITASYTFVMNKKYIEVKHESYFKPTAKNTKGEYHTDKGFISFDTARHKIIYRQFNNEGYINQYVLNTKHSNLKKLVFETEKIENFVPGGKARLTIEKINKKEISTTFDVYFPNKGYTCFGANTLFKE